MPTDRGTALLDRTDPTAALDHQAHASDEGPADLRTQAPAQPDERGASHGPRRWNDPDEKAMVWGLLFFFGLGLYAVVFVLLGAWVIR